MRLNYFAQVYPLTLLVVLYHTYKRFGWEYLYIPFAGRLWEGCFSCYVELMNN